MLHQKAVKMEEDILIHALHDYLDRKPNIADYMQCSIMYIQGCPNVYTLNYKGVPVGKIERLLEMLSYKFVFTPFVPV